MLARALFHGVERWRIAFREHAHIAFAGTVARRDARAGAYRDVFTAFPANAM
jgi:hypothetical protein